MNCINHPDQDAPYQCYRCRSPICVECETKVQGVSVCLACLAQSRQRVASRYQAETRGINYPGGVIAGVVAALAAAFAWSQFAVWGGSRLAVGAVALGGLVGYGVMTGAGGKRSRQLQQIASVTALAGIVLGHFMLFLRTQSSVYGALAVAFSSVSAALCAFPEYLCSLGGLDWLCLALGTLWAYWIPHVRAPAA